MTQLEIADSAGFASTRYRVIEELRRRKTDVVRHGTQSLEAHLANTFDILAAWKQPLRVQYAGLVHSVYSTDVFNHQTFSMDERDHIRALVGEDAERLAHLFCTIDRRELLSAVRASSMDATDTFRVSGRLDGRPVDVTGQDAGDLLAVYMANAAEQSCRPDRSPARWLSNVSLLGRDARALAEVIPPVFDRCTTLISKAEEIRFLNGYQQMIEQFADHNTPELGQRRQGHPIDWPVVSEPLIWTALHSMAHGVAVDADELGMVAAERLRRWGTPWDKRLSLHQWLQLCVVLCDATKADELKFVARRIAGAAESIPASPERLYMEFSLTGLLSSPEDDQLPSAGSGAQVRAALPQRFQTYIAGLTSNHEKPRMTTYPGLRAMPWHDPQQFRLAQDLESVAGEIAAEVQALGAGGFQEETERIKRSGRWSVLFLYERGRKNEHNCSLCPQTAAVIEANRTVLSLGGLAYFSRLEPGTHIAPHRGPTNMRLRCHLGIDVPEGCGLRVGGIERTWQERRCLVFDDSFRHEAWNDGSRPRIALVVDLWHPDLGDDEVALLNGLHRYATATGVGLVRYWNRNRSKAAPQSRPEGRIQSYGATVSQSAKPEGS